MACARHPVVSTLMLAAAVSSCRCAPLREERTLADLHVAVDAEQGRITVAHGDTVLLDMLVDAQARALGVKDGDASYTMEFGMFDIQEDLGAYRFADRLEIEAEGEDEEPLALRFLAGEELLATGLIEEDAGGVRLALTAANGNDRVTLGTRCTFAHAIGLGAQTHDVDHVGQIVPLWVSEQGVGKSDTDELPALWQLVGRRHTTHVPMPAFVTNVGAFVVDTAAFARFDLCATDAARASFEVWEPRLVLRLWGDESVREAQAKMVDALGRPPPLPSWGLGTWVDAIFGSDEVRATAQALRDAQIPASALWSEDWRGGSFAGPEVYRLDEDWRPDPVMYPDLAAMTADVGALGFKQMVYFNTFLTQGGDVFDEAVGGGYAITTPEGAPFLFTGADADFSPTGLLDLSGAEARAYMKTHLRGALDAGVRGWMADFAEWMPVDGAVLASGEDPALVHNRYPVLWQETNRAALEEAGVHDDAIAFVRSGHLGSQALAQVVWAGDQRTSFDVDDGLPTVLPIGIGLAAVGFPFVTHDVAGYQSSTNDPTDQELFFRWASLGAFSPVMRTHHGTHAAVNVQWFSNAETTAHFKRMAELHTRLFPYLRKLADDAVAPGGLPLWVPLPLLYPHDEVWALKDQVMLGPSLLVAPVLTRGAVAREVVFPTGRFVPFLADGAAVVGPTTVTVDAPVDAIPVFVPAGGIVPLLAEAVQTLVPGVEGVSDLDDTEGDRTVFVALGAEGGFTERTGATVTLTGEGVAPLDGTVVGDGELVGEGFTITLSGQPADRTTTLRCR
ncbi:MAG: hypothetical protein IT383_10215 [Deltaproteobacteria bacterium]|nr:hypothetical protein [Deltaproteobacteria bacterium]